MTSSNNEEDYKKCIATIINRLIKEKIVYPEIKKYNNSNKIKIKVLFSKPEWYTELDEDIKFHVEHNLQKFYCPNIIESLEQCLNEKDNNNQDNIETFNHTSKRLKL